MDTGRSKTCGSGGGGVAFEARTYQALLSSRSVVEGPEGCFLEDVNPRC
jgi:hypothetical protein